MVSLQRKGNRATCLRITNKLVKNQANSHSGNKDDCNGTVEITNQQLADMLCSWLARSHWPLHFRGCLWAFEPPPKKDRKRTAAIPSAELVFVTPLSFPLRVPVRDWTCSAILPWQAVDNSTFSLYEASLLLARKAWYLFQEPFVRPSTGVSDRRSCPLPVHLFSPGPYKVYLQKPEVFLSLEVGGHTALALIRKPVNRNPWICCNYSIGEPYMKYIRVWLMIF
jgi:hypothetical protein